MQSIWGTADKYRTYRAFGTALVYSAEAHEARRVGTIHLHTITPDLPFTYETLFGHLDCAHVAAFADKLLGSHGPLAIFTTENLGGAVRVDAARAPGAVAPPEDQREPQCYIVAARYFPVPNEYNKTRPGSLMNPTRLVGSGGLVISSYFTNFSMVQTALNVEYRPELSRCKLYRGTHDANATPNAPTAAHGTWDSDSNIVTEFVVVPVLNPLVQLRRSDLTHHTVPVPLDRLLQHYVDHQRLLRQVESSLDRCMVTYDLDSSVEDASPLTTILNSHMQTLEGVSRKRRMSSAMPGSSAVASVPSPKPSDNTEVYERVFSTGGNRPVEIARPLPPIRVHLKNRVTDRRKPKSGSRRTERSSAAASSKRPRTPRLRASRSY